MEETDNNPNGEINPININRDEDFSNIHALEKLSKNELVSDLWHFRIKKDKITLQGLYRRGVLNKLASYGFFKRYSGKNSYIYIREEDNIIEIAEPFQIRKLLFEYINKILSILIFTYKNLTNEI